MERLKRVFRHKQKKEKFPEICNFDLNRFNVSDPTPPEEVSDSFHWLMDFDSCSGSDHVDPDLDQDDHHQRHGRHSQISRRQYDIVKKRRNFAITRSKSFAHPVGTGYKETKLIWLRNFGKENIVHFKIYLTGYEDRNIDREVRKKKSLMFRYPKIESFENLEDNTKYDEKTISFNSINCIFQVTIL